MKKLILILTLLSLAFPGLAFDYVTNTHSQTATTTPGTYTDFKWRLSGNDDQRIILNVTSPPVLTNVSFRLVYPRRGTVFFDQKGTHTDADTRSWSIAYTNLPPSGTYFAEFLNWQGALTSSPVRVLAGGKVRIEQSIFQSTTQSDWVNPSAGLTLGPPTHSITNVTSWPFVSQVQLQGTNITTSANTLNFNDTEFGVSTTATGVATITVTPSAPTFNTIGDAAAATTIAFGDTEIVALDSSSDGEVFLTIDLLDADLATDTTALKITSVDNNDANYIPLHIQDDSAGGSPDDILKLDYQGVLTLGDGTSAAGLTIGSAALVEAELEILDGLTATTAELETLTDASNADALHGHSGVWTEADNKISFVSTNTAGTTVSIGNSSTMASDALVFSVTNAQNGVLFSIDEDGQFVMKAGITFSSSVFVNSYGMQATYGNIFTAGTIPYVHWQDYTTDEADWTLSVNEDDFIFTSDEVGEAMRIQGDTGYVGIGKADPSVALDVVGNLTVSSIITATEFRAGQAIRLEPYRSKIREIADDGVHFVLDNTSGGVNRNLIICDEAYDDVDHDHDTLSPDPTLFIQSATDPRISNNEWGSWTHDDDNMIFSTGPNVGAGTSPIANEQAIVFAPRGVEKVRIDGSGNVGIGTETPDETFEIEWAAAVDVEIGRGSTDTDQTFITLRSPDGTKFYIEVNDAGVLSASTTKP